MYKIMDVRCEYQKNPVGIGVKQPRISWKAEADKRGTVQACYHLQVAKEPSFKDIVWDSGKVESDQSIHVEVKEFQAESRTRYYFRVRAENVRGETTGWSEPGYWETGILDVHEWQAEWICPPLELPAVSEAQCPQLRKRFTVPMGVKSARIYATALGLYELELNGARVGDAYFTPGWTSYHHRLQYQTYDVTNLLTAGENTVGAILGNGWYKGNLGWEKKSALYGDRLALLFQLHIVLEDGSEQVILSDKDWEAAASPIVMSEIYHGETYDARLELEESRWHPAEILSHTKDILTAQENVPVRKKELLKPKELLTTPKGEMVIDMGQNMVGWVRFAVTGQKGREVQLRHAEVLDKDGNFYTDNLRAAKQTIRYILKGGEKETFEPHFTFQGFRFVQLIGFERETIDLEDFTGVVLHSDMEATGEFRCSDPLVNQLQHNILWGLKGNFLDVPTDCPQRDERLGWTGDAQMFVRTAAYLANVAPFFTKWLRDLEREQADDGGVPFVVPNVLGTENGGTFGKPFSSAAWGDAAVICPWTIYLCYGDERLLEEQYDSMKAWVEYIRKQGENEYLWNTGFHFGDWLGLDAKPDSYVGATDKALIATSFYAYSVSILMKTASVLHKTEDARGYGELYTNIIHALTAEFVTPAGRLAVPTQTAQVLVLMFELLEGPAVERAVSKLVELLEESEFHLTTGFVGTPYLSHVLSRHGQTEIAYKLLFQKDYPSWLYQVTKGATTIWEHWDGIREDGSFWSKDMNSFNHYAYGAIGDWLYRTVAGIELEESSPAYKQIHIRPQPGDKLNWAEGKLESMYGTIRSAWYRKQGGKMEVQVTIPPNTTARIVLPNAQGKTVTESGAPVHEAAGITSVEVDADGLLLEAGSGNYLFEY
ncbi:alpha-L-rhamnosidase [Evansella caseinilytica]|uniref:alpha-L-rhamnosidase n=1 Tax=Evansella caseinilytica TaxID=1503961 RepID=A0A1H3IRE7_9BACI|nr:family 78 glycoside hydrolase catalytic domain [Evansella caseinilytica]SDY30403.1 alpha-L-rhamnosidase [Evansella caseinilytica]